MLNKISYTYFIDRGTYTKLLGKDVLLKDIADLFRHGPGKNKNISALTETIILKTNDHLYRAFFSDSIYVGNTNLELGYLETINTKTAVEYIKDYLSPKELSYNNGKIYPRGNVVSSESTYNPTEELSHAFDADKFSKRNKKYYELIPLDGNDVLIIVGESFFNYVTENKNQLLEFVLTCIRHQYKYNFDFSNLMKLYVGLNIDESLVDVVKLRYN